MTAPADRQQHPDTLFDYCPWLFEKEASTAQRAAQRERQRRLADTAEVHIGQRCFVSPAAAVHPMSLTLGDGTYVGAHAYVTGSVRAGEDCTFNPFTTVRGIVTLGDAVRIGAHTSLLGFNHGTAPDSRVHQQPIISKGITVGDDVWIGSHSVVVDGVTIGDHCVIGAGSVVTRDVPDWAVVAGNPARLIRDRRDPRGTRAQATGLDERLARLADAAREQADALLERCWDGERYRDRPTAPPTVRAHCDAVEIADLLLGRAPAQLPAAGHAERLRAAQDPATGLIPALDPATGQPRPLPEPDPDDGFVDDGAALYHVLAAGYALRLLDPDGPAFRHPVHTVRRLTADRLLRRLDRLPWRERAWHAGSWIDAYATAVHFNLDHADPDAADPAAAPAPPAALESLFGWLLTRVDPWTGLWGDADPAAGRLQPVNGFYRLTRGSFAQFGLPVPHPERVIDTVLDHARDPRYFGHDRENACNVLDVAHPLWLAARQTGHRAAESRAWAETQLTQAVGRWHDGRGFGFGPAPDGTGPGREPGLQGTEMWLAILWLLADLTGRADLLGYRPRGVHRPEPARTPPRRA